MWQRVGDGSGRRALLFRSGYSTLAGIKKENKKLNQQENHIIVRFQKDDSSTKI